MSSFTHERIKKRLAELELTAEAASKLAGLDKTYLRKLFERPDASPRGDTLARLAAALGKPVEWFIAGAPADSVPGAAVRPAPVALPDRNAMPNDVPVLGTAAGSHLRGAFQMDEANIVDWVRRPPALAGAKTAYAIYVEGSSMAPEHNAGDLRFVHPGRPPRIGDTVIVQLRNGPHEPIEASIGHYRRKTATQLVIGKLNPEAEVQLKLDIVIDIHKVLTMNELFGV